MDGTIADLYGVENWLGYLRNEDTLPYENANPMWDMHQLREVLLELILQGWEIRVITWASKNASDDFLKKCEKAKKQWLRKHNFPHSVTHVIRYGSTKANSIRHLKVEAVLIDDNPNVRAGWKLGATIDPTEGNLIEKLRALLEPPE